MIKNNKKIISISLKEMPQMSWIIKRIENIGRKGKKVLMKKLQRKNLWAFHPIFSDRYTMQTLRIFSYMKISTNLWHLPPQEQSCSIWVHFPLIKVWAKNCPKYKKESKNSRLLKQSKLGTRFKWKKRLLVMFKLLSMRMRHLGTRTRKQRKMHGCSNLNFFSWSSQVLFWFYLKFSSEQSSFWILWFLISVDNILFKVRYNMK